MKALPNVVLQVTTFIQNNDSQPINTLKVQNKKLLAVALLTR